MSDMTMEQKIQNFRELVLAKQDELIPGTNITIDENNVISATGSIGGTATWPELAEKPFSSIDTNTLTVENDTLKINTTDDAERDNTKPITSSGVYTLIGNIDVLLSQI